MTNIVHFIDALKIAWLKKYMHVENNSKWKIIFFFKNELSKLGELWIWSCKPPCIADFNYGKIHVTFLKDVLKSWSELRNATACNKDNDALWYNSNIMIGEQTVYYENWSLKGVNFVSDLIENKQWMSYGYFCNKYDINCNFLKYFGIVSAICGTYRDQLTECNQSKRPNLLVDLESAIKESSFAYGLLNQCNVVPTAQQKWQAEIETDDINMHDIDWKAVYAMPYKCTIDVKSQYFQYRFIHKILPSNEFLFKIGIVESDKCTFCGVEKETIKHVMWSCDKISSFWKEVIKWLEDLNIEVTLSFNNVCFGVYNRSQTNFINMILIWAKRFIYKCKYQETKVIFQDYKQWVIHMQKVERFIAVSKDKLGSHLKKWDPML